jgi:D-alanine transaminase
MTDNIAYVNGEFLPHAEACISIDDRGLVFGDAIYEVIKCYSQRPFRLRDHLERLKRGAEEIRLPLPLDEESVVRAIDELLARNVRMAESSLYVQVTRGPGSRFHAFPRVASPTIIMVLSPAAPLDPSDYEQGVRVITVPDRRWDMCNVKSVGLLIAVLAKQSALDAGAADAVFVRAGRLVEGASANFFAVSNGRLITHPEGRRILAGVTRKVVLELAAATGLGVDFRGPKVDEIGGFDEAFLTGTGTEILPVSSIDGTTVGQGGRGSITAELQRRFFDVTRTGVLHDRLAGA